MEKSRFFHIKCSNPVTVRRLQRVWILLEPEESQSGQENACYGCRIYNEEKVLLAFFFFSLTKQSADESAAAGSHHEAECPWTAMIKG